jgi:glycosyltransferase involved in cell wall biosynthesis
MLRNQEIVYITSDWHTENRTSTHHIAEELSRHNRILYVEAAGMRAPRASGRDLRKVLRKLAGCIRRPRRVAPNIYLFSPVILPLHRFGAVRALNRWLLAVMVRRAMNAVGFKRPLVWLFMPHFASLAEDIDSRGVIYYVTDEYTATPHVDRDRIAEMERLVLERADVVFVVSQHLYDRKSKLNRNVHVSRHGVDVAHFARSADAETEVPADINSIPRPIAGFFGLVEQYIDLDLLAHAARKLPHVSFVMIGRVARDIDPVKDCPNVHFLGRRDYAELPAYMKAFDVCLLLYQLGPFSANANPKKLREYIAGGKPVVSVRIGEVEQYRHLVRVADDYDQYVREIEAAILTDSPAQVSSRLAAMAAESWEAKVDRVGEIVAASLAIDAGAQRGEGGHADSH